MGKLPVLVDDTVHKELKKKKLEDGHDSFNDALRELLFGKEEENPFRR